MNNKIELTDDMLENIWGGTQIPYIVQSGDTLGELVKKFHCTIEEACEWNNISNPNILSANQKLIFKF